MLRKIGVYNDLSEDLVKPTLLKPGQTAVYKVDGIVPNPYNPGHFIIPFAKNVPPTDIIWDEGKQQYVEIAAVRSMANDKYDFYEIFFFANSAGHLVLTGGSAEHQTIHTYLTLCNYNGSNPNRDTNKPILFWLVDEEKKSEQDRKIRNKKREALNIAHDLDMEEVRNYTASLGKDDTRPVEVLRNELEEYADKDPEAFIEMIRNQQSVQKAVLNRAIAKGVIRFEAEQSRFVWANGEVIATVARTTGGDNVEDLLAFCVSSAKGEKVYQTIASKSKK